MNRKIVFANGCFDVLHPGHYKFLQLCISISKDKNADLILALDSDEKVKKDKGVDRPIFSWKERANHLSNLFPDIFLIIPFNDNSQLEQLIQTFKPVLVKGERWKEKVIGKKYAEEVVYIPDFKSLPSTTEIINRIRHK